MINRLDDFGGEGPLVLFAHANGYPPQCYRQLQSALSSDYHLIGLKHRALWSRPNPPAKINWNAYAQDLIQLAEYCCEQSNERSVWIMGHSLGATSALLAALKREKLFKGLILLDPVLLPTRLVTGLKVIPRRLHKKFSIISKTLGRPDRWQSKRDAFDFHRDKRAYQNLSDESLWDFINGGTVKSGAVHREHEIQLAFSKYWEAHIYSTPPWMWGALHKLKLPTLGVRGEHSDVLKPLYWQRWQRRQPGGIFKEIPDCGHLLPLEKPMETAQVILNFLNENCDNA